MTIKPALTETEWAARRTDEAYLAPSPLDPSGADLLHVLYDSGCASEVITDRMALAALCLHGRLSWEMVDALRNLASARIEWPDGSVANPEHPVGDDIFGQLADLLESLLPPR